ncbi:MAG: hypothetical protein FXF47_05340, partial [Candidatus Mcinerneyibacterium aminivorans]
MKKYLISFVLILLVMNTICGGELQSKKNKANQIENRQDFFIKEDITEDVYINNSEVKLMASIEGDLILENSLFEIKSEGKVKGNIYIINSKIITSTTEIEADYSVAKISGENKGVEIKGASKGKKRSEKKSHPAFWGKIKFNFTLFLFLLLIYYLLKTQIFEQKEKFRKNFMKDILIGVVFWILFPFITVLLIGSVIGIPVWLIFLMFLIFGLLMGIVIISLWVGENFYNKKNLLGFITGYVTVILIDYILFSLDYLIPILNISWIAYLYWIAVIFISTGITVRFLKSIFSKNRQ